MHGPLHYLAKALRIFLMVVGGISLTLIALLGIGILSSLLETRTEWLPKMEHLARAADIDVLDSATTSSPFLREYRYEYIIRFSSEEAEQRFLATIFRCNSFADRDDQGSLGYLSDSDGMEARFCRLYGKLRTYQFDLFGECPYGGHHAPHSHHDFMGVIAGRDHTYFVRYMHH